MRVYAKMSPKLWSGELADAIRGDMDALALAPYLIAGPHSNRFGIYRLPVSYIAEDLGMPLERASKALAKLVKHGFCMHDESSRMVWVVLAAAHEEGSTLNVNDNRTAGLSKALVEIVAPFRKYALTHMFAAFYAEMWGAPVDPLLQALGEPPDRASVVLGKPSASPPGGLPPQEQEQEKEQEKEQEQEGSSEPGGLEAAVLEFECAGPQKVWKLTQAKIEEYQASFPGVDVKRSTRRAWQWLRDNPSRRKTARGMPAFLSRWLGVEQDRSRPGTPPPRHQARANTPLPEPHVADRLRAMEDDAYAEFARQEAARGDA